MSKLRIKQLISFCCCVAVLSGFTGCETPKVLLDLSKSSIDHAQALKTSNGELFEIFDNVTDESKRQALQRAYELGMANRKEFNLRIAAKKQALKNYFEAKATDLLERDFPNKLEEIYVPNIEDQITKYTNLAAKEKTLLDTAPTDFRVREKYLNLQMKALEIAALGLQKQNELRYHFKNEIDKVRTDIWIMIDKDFEELERKAGMFPFGEDVLSAEAFGDSATGKQIIAPYENVRESLKSDREKFAVAFDGLTESMETIDAYLNRPSKLELLFKGGLEEVRTTISGLFGSDSVVGKFLSEKVNGLEGDVTEKVGNLESKIETKVNDLATTLSNKLEIAALKFAPATSSDNSNQ